MGLDLGSEVKENQGLMWGVEIAARESLLSSKSGVSIRVGCPQRWPETVASSLDVMKELDSGNCKATLPTIPPHCLPSSD